MLDPIPKKSDRPFAVGRDFAATAHRAALPDIKMPDVCGLKPV